MKKIIYIVLLIILSVGLQAQINRDSLWNFWQDETKSDDERLKAINKFAWDGYLYSKPDSAFYFAQLQYDFAKRKGVE